jgi:hypothetical protein
MDKPKKKKGILTSSAKAKGRKLQQHVRDQVLHYFPELQKDDVRSTPMGVTGSDLTLSPKAQEIFPFKVECKNRAAMAVFRDFEQAWAGCAPWMIPLVVLKENNSKPLAVVDLDFFLHAIRGNYDYNKLHR